MARAAGRSVFTGLLIAACGLLTVTVVVPIATGSDTYAELTRSMEPGMPPGTLLVVRPVAAGGLHAGDVVTYQLRPGRPEVVTQRIVRIDTSADGTKEYITRGDADGVADPSPVRPEQVEGRVWYTVPAVGWLAIVKDGASLQPWLIGIGALLLLYSLVSIVSWARTRNRRSAPVVHRETYIPL